MSGVASAAGGLATAVAKRAAGKVLQAAANGVRGAAGILKRHKLRRLPSSRRGASAWLLAYSA